MAIVYQAQDADEFWHDSDAEQMGNQHNYGVISGCGVTYDAANMTYDIAAGTILHNGLVVTVAAQVNANTLVADSTNPRWTLISLDSTGTQVMTSGTAAATPGKPEVGDNVLIAAVKIEAAQTIANNISVKLDKRVMTHLIALQKYKYKTATQDFTTTTLTDVTATSGNIAFALAATTAYRLVIDIDVSAVGTAASGGFKWTLAGITAPTAFYASMEGQVQINDGAGLSLARQVHADLDSTGMNTRTMGTAFGASNSSNVNVTGIAVGLYRMTAFILTNTAGTVTLQAAQNTAAGTSTIAAVVATLAVASAE